MNKKSVNSLEFDKIIQLLASEVNTALGKKLVYDLKISTDFDHIRLTQDETSEAQKLLLEGTSISVNSLDDLSSMLKIAKIGGSVDLQALLDAAKNLNLSRIIANKLKDRDDLPILHAKSQSLYANHDLEETIFQSIISNEEVSDDASPDLKKIRREINVSKDRIKSKLDQIISSASTSKYLQDTLVTMRQDRYVVPVKSEYRSSFSGIVHDTSSSGATVFIEPMAVVELNNNLRMLMHKEKEEINRIILALSNQLGLYADEILLNQNILSEIDFIMGKGKFSIKLKAISPRINQNKVIILKNARHPLIDKDAVVPLNFKIGDQYSTLVITGPNTGGKTVAIKTVGLFVLMVQAGLHIPCDYGTSVYIFDNIFVDIGDDQSISQNLSTFSSHMKNIVNILKETTNKSLVILDELGSGTDPDEGSALAIAILEHLKNHKVTTIATTHYSNLKSYALNTPFVENASVEFDIKTLSPTYRLLIGVPGKSNAFNISRKLGLQDSIIKTASQYLSEDTIKMEDILIKIDKDRQEIEAEKERINITSENVQARLSNLERKEKRLDENRDKVIKQANIEAQKIIRSAQAESDSILKKLRRIEKDSSKIDNKGAERLRVEMSALKNRHSIKEALVQASDSDNLISEDEIIAGKKVYVDSFQKNATVVSIDPKRQQAVVQIDNMKINVPFKALSKEKVTAPRQSRENIGTIHRRKASSIRSEIDIRGLDSEAAMEKLTKYLDDAFLSNIQTITIIHGLGTGVLKKTVEDLLKSLNYIKEYRPGNYGEGGQGITIVKFK